MILLLAAAPLTDAQLVSRATAPFSQAHKENRHEVLDRWRGHPVLADYPCSDLCPAYTVRIVHLDLPADATCADAGGRIVAEAVPVSIASVQRRFCVPAPLAGPALLPRSRTGR